MLALSGLALSGLADPAQAQAAADGAIQLPPLSVESSTAPAAGDYKTDLPALHKLTEPLRDTPQSITTVPRQVIEDRGATTLGDVLRTVPGISLAAGENGAQGTNLTIRGFTARNDIFLDGMRDFGSYYRDPFDLESVEVLEGPASILFGRGSTGGVVNQVSKAATLQAAQSATLAFGTDGTKRLTADVDQPIDALQGTALRLAVMGHESNVADRNVAEYQRFGVAPTLAFGIGTPTRLTLGYLHQSEDDTPDYGLPWRLGSPAPVDRANFYGFRSDYLKTDADIGTARIEHDLGSTVTLRDQLRFARYDRDFRITEPQTPAGTGFATPLASLTETRNQLSGRSVETMLQNQTDVTARFDIGPVGHALVAGIEAGRETSSPIRRTFTGVPGANLLSPDDSQAFSYATGFIASRTNTAATSVGVYAVDTLKVGPQWEATGGVRWDRFDATYRQTTYAASGTPTGGTAFDRVDEMPSWRAALVYKPLPTGSVYVAYGTSFNPSAESLSLSTATANVAPEKNRSFEVGSKWDVLDERLSLHGSVFRLEKTNARVPDPNDTSFTVLGGTQQIDGFDIEAAGRVTEHWQISTGYTFLDSKVVKSSAASTAAVVGEPLTNTPKHSATLWTTYQLPWGLQVGGGGQYLSTRVARNTLPLESVPGYVTLDAMAKLQLTERVALQVNVTNLTDKYYYDQLHPGHVIPGAGRSALFTLSFRN